MDRGQIWLFCSPPDAARAAVPFLLEYAG